MVGVTSPVHLTGRLFAFVAVAVGLGATIGHVAAAYVLDDLAAARQRAAMRRVNAELGRTIGVLTGRL